MKTRRLKKFRVCLFSICLLLQMLQPLVYVAETASGKDIIAEVPEREIPADAIYISTPEDLMELAENCRLNTWSEGKTVVLLNDIDLTGVEFRGIPTFLGCFFGQGYTIRGISMAKEGSVQGFFRYLLESAKVYDLNLEGEITPTGSKSIVGGFAGQNAGLIENCSFTGTVSGGNQIGGFVGINETTGIIDNGTMTGVLFGNHFVGGLAGENHGVIRNCSCDAKINSEASENNVSLEEITVENLMDTEYANTATDIGGIAGSNSGVIRACVNHGAIGYTSMGYNIGGIAGSQKGYMADCINYGNIRGRKEIGGIVGQMEPNIHLTYNIDTLQMLSPQLESLMGDISDFRHQINADAKELDALLEDLQQNTNEVKNASDALKDSLHTEREGVDSDRLTASLSDLGGSMKDMIKSGKMLADSTQSASSDIKESVKGIADQVNGIADTLDSGEDPLSVEWKDISDEDTEEDVLGKAADCINYGEIQADFHAGGIAGIMAEETDLDVLEDITISGKFSVNSTYYTRTVIRGCRNYGTISVRKQQAGGIAGNMTTGCILECVNFGHMDCLGADYIGGIAGKSHTIIRNSSSKCKMSGADYVGGIAGKGKVVTDCYAFLRMNAYKECYGAIAGNVEFSLTNLTGKEEDSTEQTVRGNYYFADGDDPGGIDGISYSGAAEPLTLEEFLALEGLDEAFGTVRVCFIADGQEELVFSLTPGMAFPMEQIPEPPAMDGHDGAWQGMESANLQYILFDETFTASYQNYGKVIEAEQKSENGFSILLAEGEFPSGTLLDIRKVSEEEAMVKDRKVLTHWQVALERDGDVILHYLMPEEAQGKTIQILVKKATGDWRVREFETEGSYLVFEFREGETAFCLTEAPASGIHMGVVIAGVAVLLVGILLVIKIFCIYRRKSIE